MKKTVIAIALAMMGILFAGCNKDVEPDRGVAQKIIGQWITAETDSKVLPTNEKIVYDFVSTSKAYESLSFTDNVPDADPWRDRIEVDMEIYGNDVTLTHSPKPGMIVVEELHVEAITNTTMIAKRHITIRKDGGLVKSEEKVVRYEKLNADYGKAICGLWEGRMISDQSEYDDGQEHRWEFKDDGTFVFYLKNNKGIWEKKEDEYAQYFVAGNLLCTRWKNAGEGTQENREWWEITAMSGGSMIWTALREKADGTQYTAAYSMKKVSVPTKAEIEKAIIGKWMTEKFNGEVALTDQKAVFTFLSKTQATITASVDDKAAGLTGWICQHEYDYEVEGNTITFTSKVDEHTTYVEEMIVDYLDSESLCCQHKHTEIVDGASRPSPTITVELKKQEKTPVKYSSYILGTWEGRAISDRSGNDDGKVHRWEYTGTSYVYYVMNGGNWVPSSNSTNEYFVDGRLLLTRWVDNGVEYREWWEIMALDDHTMVWTALRRDEYGDLYTASFSMTKVN